MKNFYKGILSAAALTTAVLGANAQSQLKFKSDAESFVYSEKATLDREVNELTNLRATETCTDTSDWAWARSLQDDGSGNIQATYFSAFLHAEANVPNSYGTYVDVPANTSITVSGFSFYGRSIRTDNDDVTVNAVIYNAGPDSLPSGAALATIPITLDTTTSGFISAWTQEAIFSSAVTVNSSFIISVENSATVGDSVELLRGFTGSGAADDFPVVYEIDGFNGGAYTRLPGTTFGARLPHFYPFVSFDQTNDFTMSVSQLSGPNESVDFTYDGPSITDHPVWSLSGIIGDTTSTWSFDGGTNKVQGRDISNTFADDSQDYTIVLYDTIVMWNGPRCILTETKTLSQNPNVGIEEIANGTFNAYAANGEIFIANAKGIVRLYNITGRIVKQFNANNQFETLNVSDLSEGIYILESNDKAIKLKL